MEPSSILGHSLLLVCFTPAGLWDIVPAKSLAFQKYPCTMISTGQAVQDPTFTCHSSPSIPTHQFLNLACLHKEEYQEDQYNATPTTFRAIHLLYSPLLTNSRR